MSYRETLETVAALIVEDSKTIDINNVAHTVDVAATLRLHIKELTKVEKALTLGLTGDVELTRETDQGAGATIPGIHFYANIAESIRWALDTKALKAEFGDTWYDARCKQTVVRSVKYFDAV